MRYINWLFMLGLILAISACSTKPDRGQKAEPSFITDIRSDGSKRFTLLLTHAQSAQGRGNRGSRNEGGTRGRGNSGRPDTDSGRQGRRPRQQNRNAEPSTNSGGEQNEDMREKMLSLVYQHLADTSYCRHGYIELSYSQLRDQTELLGECQESASEEDKERWD